eukprot:snap_masked-scaffold_14-processed-gene-11.13-mRNA-1 protein AED:1.00 eAED:1.00 QI:0/0/0/0/1/1/2/0/71
MYKASHKITTPMIMGFLIRFSTAREILGRKCEKSYAITFHIGKKNNFNIFLSSTRRRAIRNLVTGYLIYLI